MSYRDTDHLYYNKFDTRSSTKTANGFITNLQIPEMLPSVAILTCILDEYLYLPASFQHICHFRRQYQSTPIIPLIEID